MGAQSLGCGFEVKGSVQGSGCGVEGLVLGPLFFLNSHCYDLFGGMSAVGDLGTLQEFYDKHLVMILPWPGGASFSPRL